MMDTMELNENIEVYYSMGIKPQFVQMVNDFYRQFEENEFVVKFSMQVISGDRAICQATFSTPKGQYQLDFRLYCTSHTLEVNTNSQVSLELEMSYFANVVEACLNTANNFAHVW